MPDFSIEREMIAHHPGLVAGVDEAGRGPWAGPVVAGAVLFPDESLIPEGLDDSKKMSEAKRERLFERLSAMGAEGQLFMGVGVVSPQEIDRMNILAASLHAMTLAVDALKVRPTSLLIDGNKLPVIDLPAKALVKGDGRSLSIAAASIIAKVTRDRMMLALDKEFPHYLWAQNKGYGTKAHREALGLHGVSPHHRCSFKPIKALIEA
jgi:ribonuclease HII